MTAFWAKRLIKVIKTLAPAPTPVLRSACPSARAITALNPSLGLYPPLPSGQKSATQVLMNPFQPNGSFCSPSKFKTGVSATSVNSGASSGSGSGARSIGSGGVCDSGF